MTVTWPGTDDRVAAQSCRAGCGVDPSLRRHHDRLLAVESDVDELLELIELAVTWGELNYCGVSVVPPGQWLEFAACHEWRDPDRAARIFSVATDIALRTGRRETAPAAQRGRNCKLSGNSPSGAPEAGDVVDG